MSLPDTPIAPGAANPNPASPAPEPGPTLQQLLLAHRALRTQFIAVLITLAVLNFSLNVYLWKQSSMAHKDAVEIEQNLDGYKLNFAPKMSAFIASLQEFAKTHPDFAQIMAKYHLTAKYPFLTPNASAIPLPPSDK